jgi:hypothetical protein
LTLPRWHAPCWAETRFDEPLRRGSADDQVIVGELPAGRYLETTYHGHPDGLCQADLLVYADAQGLTFEKTDSPTGEQWAARLEYYLNDPDDQPDLTQWDTTLSFKLTDGA